MHDGNCRCGSRGHCMAGKRMESSHIFGRGPRVIVIHVSICDVPAFATSRVSYCSIWSTIPS